ncbi:MAG TPA: choice-of-anchor tandem repeat GloVer-containing protein [Verrucomicrobiae bacterium]|jgi:uncharacterized repeat protein (TIGR03803 family)
MRTSIKKFKWLTRTLLMSPVLLLGEFGQAQAPAILHSFTVSATDGSNPYGNLLQAGDQLYGTTYSGGSGSDGTVFVMNTNGSGFTLLHSFNSVDGQAPQAGLILSGNTLYGTTASGGASQRGTVFAVNTDGSGFTTLYNFIGGGDGSSPQANLILSGNTLYGTTAAGGSGSQGTVFAVKTDGTGFTTLHSFTGADGFTPQGSLVLSGNTLYGTTAGGGSGNQGTVFALNLSGSSFTTLHSFSGPDGVNLQAGLILSGNTLYGTTISGGLGYGTVFAINTDGTGFATLHSFSGDAGGSNPRASLVLSGNTLYGTASSGGTNSFGTVFAIALDGSDFTTFYKFTGGADGSNPQSGLTLAGNTLYGMANLGGSSGHGTIFAFNLPSTSFVNVAYYRDYQTNWQISVSDLLTNVNGSGNNSFSLASVTPSTNGITLVVNNGELDYSNPNLVDDQFTGTAVDSQGDTVAIIVTLYITSAPPLGGHVEQLTLTNNTAVISFSGIPTYLYAVQVSTNLSAWTTLTTTNAPADGQFQFNDTNPPQPNVFYRLLWNGN